MDVRFTAINYDGERVTFTLQDYNGNFRSFCHPDFDLVCQQAINLVRPPFIATDTDQLIGPWFELPEHFLGVDNTENIGL